MKAFTSKIETMLKMDTSVSRRAAALFAIAIVAVAFVTIGFSTWQTGNVAREGVRALTVNAASQTAANLAPHTRFGNADAVQAELERHAELADAYFHAIYAWDASGQLLGSVSLDGQAVSDDLSAFGRDAFDTAASLSSGDGFTIAEPIVFDAAAGPVGSVVVVWTPRAVLTTLAYQRAIAVAGLAVMILLMLAIATRTLRSGIGAPIEAVAAAMGVVAKGQYDQTVPQQSRRDEVGAIAQSLELLRKRLADAKDAEALREAARQEQISVVARLAKALRAMADGDMTHQIHEEMPNEYEEVRTDFNRAVIRLAELLSEATMNAQTVTDGSHAITRSSDDLAQRTEQQAATLEETAAALEQLTGSVKTAADGAQKVEAAVLDARGTAEESRTIVASAMSAMAEIEKSSNQVSQIIGLIEEIAFQTNLLALNAGVEAARAGDAGRGFAVVASEVRGLAQRASEAAQEIKTLITQSSGQVTDGVQLVSRAGDALNVIAEKVSSISTFVSDIARETVDQASGLQEINTAVGELDRFTQENAVMVEESNAAAHSLASDAQTMATLVAQFKLEPRETKTPFAQTRSVA